MSKVQEVLEKIVFSVVEKPDEVKIETKTDEMGILLTLKVAEVDMGKLIGKAGETAKSIRHIIRVVGFSENARVSLKIDDPDGYQPRRTRSEYDQTVDELNR